MKTTIAALVLCSAWLTTQGCDQREEPTAAHASRSAPSQRVSATGKIEGVMEADVASKLSGRIARYLHAEGDEVEAGAPVVQLEARDLEARVREAAARARLARLALDRVRKLSAEHVVSRSELDQVSSEHAAAAATLDEVGAEFEYATIRAPFRGTVVRKFKEVGEAVSITIGPDPLFRLADLSRLKVTAEVPENEIAGLRVGQRADVSTDAYPGERFPATVARVGLAAGRKRLRSDDPRERLDEKVIEVELHLPGDARLRSGMTVDVAIDVADPPDLGRSP
jgi:RND family efflux transporter MFP subunit